jgi:hypothetical protein
VSVAVNAKTLVLTASSFPSDRLTGKPKGLPLFYREAALAGFAKIYLVLELALLAP